MESVLTKQDVHCRNRAVVHPTLRGGQPTSGHRLWSSQLDALTAICDTILPSINFNLGSEGLGSEHASKSKHDVLETYYRVAASECAIPLEAAGAMATRLKRSLLRLTSFALWLFSTRLGTLLLGGRYAVVSTFPFISNFAGLTVERREKLLISLSNSSIFTWQEVFRFFKCIICWTAFTKIDKDGRNCLLMGMNYEVGEETDEAANVAERESYSKPKQVRDRLVDARAAGERLEKEFARMGVETLTDLGPLRHLQRRKGGRTDAASTEVGVCCDVAVIGSGAGGSVVAAKLGEKGYRVVVLEKGQYFEEEELSQFEGPSMNAMYEEGACLVTDDSRMLLLAGSTLGGGTTINWSASFRTPPHVRKEWSEKSQLKLFSTPTYDDAMDTVCERLSVQRDVAHENFQNSVLRRGCCVLGYHVDNIPRNSPPDHRCGLCGLGCKQGKKQGAIRTWLDDAARAGAVVVVNCKAEEVLSRKEEKGVGGVVAGVLAHVNGRPLDKVYVKADVVVVACGALRTPPLLKRSGLRNGAIGRNLHLHPVQLVWGYFPEGTGPEGVCYRGGIMTAYSNVAANWSTSGYGALLQCPAVQPGIVAVALPWISGKDFKTRMLKVDRTAFFIVLTRDRGSGYVNVDSEDKLCVRYQIADVDKESLRSGAELGLRVLLAAGAREVGSLNNDGASFSPLHTGSQNFEPAFDEFLSHVRANSFQKLSTLTVSAHQMGSCRMGTHSSTSAVDPQCQTWEVSGLFVADSSVFPTATGVNPMITIQSIALCTAKSILEYLQQHRH